MVRYHPRELGVPRVARRLEGRRSKGRIRELEAQCRAPRGTADLGHRAVAAKGLVNSLDPLGILAVEAAQSPAGIKDKELPVPDRLDRVRQLLVAGMADLIARVQRISTLEDRGLKLVLDVPAVIKLARAAVKVSQNFDLVFRMAIKRAFRATSFPSARARRELLARTYVL